MKLKKALVSLACRAGDRLKPALIQILPKALLKKIKSRLIASAYTKKQARLPYDPTAFPHGINLIGYIRAQMGLGQGCRLMASALEASGIPFGILETRVGNPFHHEDHTWDHKIVKELRYGINLFHVNPEQMPPLQLTLPSDALDRRYHIGIWLWELPEFPDEWSDAFSLVDEIWAPSHFNCESIAKKSPVPVYRIPYGISAPCEDSVGRSRFGLPEDLFLFLCMYDANSTLARKNPTGAIQAYRKAFPDEAGVGLVVKINNPTGEDLQQLSKELEGCQHIYLLQETYTKEEVNSLIRCADVFLSLHRAEGFGLVIAEAMLLGTPVVATNWSANVDFMDQDNSCPVSYTLTPIREDCGSYRAGQIWAEPDTGHAAQSCRRLFEDQEFRDRIRRNAQKDIQEKFSIQASAEAIQARIREITKASIQG